MYSMTVRIYTCIDNANGEIILTCEIIIESKIRTQKGPLHTRLPVIHIYSSNRRLSHISLKFDGVRLTRIKTNK